MMYTFDFTPENNNIKLVNPLITKPDYIKKEEELAPKEVIDKYKDILTDKQLLILNKLTMKKYKLKQWYPGLPKDWKEGTVVEQGDEGVHHCYFKGYNDKFRLNYEEVENNPKYWTAYIFTSVDGVDMFVGERYYFTVNSTIFSNSKDTLENWKLEESDYERFSTEKAAQEYIDKDKIKVGDWVVRHRDGGMVDEVPVGSVWKVTDIKCKHFELVGKSTRWSDFIFRKATKDEILKHLISEAEKKGFKVGSEYQHEELIGTIKYFFLIDEEYLNSGKASDLTREALKEKGICLGIKDDGVSMPFHLIKLYESLTFGGHKVTIESTTDNVYVSCNGITGTFKQLNAIYQHIKKQAEKVNLQFGNIKENIVEFATLSTTDGHVLVSDDLVIQDDDKIRIGCTTGTWKELKDIIYKCIDLQK